jgi:biotin carboxylase
LALTIRHLTWSFFYDQRRKWLSILEVNPRQSQSHGKLFEKVAGASNHEVMIDIAVGDAPDFPESGGEFRCAAKFFLRHHQDAIVHEVPTQRTLHKIRQEIPGTDVEIHVKEGMRLAQLYDQDSYSYEIANIYIGAKNRQALFSKHKRCLERLNFKFSEKEKAQMVARPPYRPFGSAGTNREDVRP